MYLILKIIAHQLFLITFFENHTEEWSRDDGKITERHVYLCWWVLFCRHFMQADSKKFEDVWCMNETECKELVNTLVEADRAIHEQQLGIHYQNPDLWV